MQREFNKPLEERVQSFKFSLLGLKMNVQHLYCSAKTMDVIGANCKRQNISESLHGV